MAPMRIVKQSIGEAPEYEVTLAKNSSFNTPPLSERSLTFMGAYWSAAKSYAKQRARNPWNMLGCLLILGTLWWGASRFGILPSGDFPVISSSKFQSVFLTNGQVYFGHLSNYNASYARLTKIYYLQVAQPLQQGATTPQSFSLQKLGGELHGPEDAMLIPKDKILFYENLKSDSQVVRAIGTMQ